MHFISSGLMKENLFFFSLTSVVYLSFLLRKSLGFLMPSLLAHHIRYLQLYHFFALPRASSLEFTTGEITYQHNYETSSSIQGNLTKLFYKTNKHGKYSITVNAVESWNKIQKQLKDMLLKELSPKKIKTIVSNFYLKSY